MGGREPVPHIFGTYGTSYKALVPLQLAVCEGVYSTIVMAGYCSPRVVMVAVSCSQLPSVAVNAMHPWPSAAASVSTELLC